MMDLKTDATLLHAAETMQASGAAVTLDADEREAIETIQTQAQRVIDRAIAAGRGDEVRRQTSLVIMRAAARTHELVIERSR